MKHPKTVIDEVRAARDAIAKAGNYDVRKIAAAGRAREAKSGRKVVTLQPRPPARVRKAG